MTPSPTDDKPPSSAPEREQTDESLRVEREEVDEALGEEVAAIDETADAIINRARARADEVLGAARTKEDRRASSPTDAPAVARARKREDEALHRERDQADATLRAERAEHVALLSIHRDETDKDLSSERALSDDALATRDEFLGVVSHDLRSILSSIVLFAGLIGEVVTSENPVEQVRKYAQRIQRSAHRMSRLIGDLIDVANIEAGALVVTREMQDPTPIVTEAVETLQVQAAANKVSLAADLVPPPTLAALDAARILQVLVNLLSNAIKFTPADGKVVVRVERIGGELRFAVSDTGIGIPADKLETIFERFLQVEEGDRRGVGLGLYISKCIVQGHGGRIWAESSLGKGSTFYFTLPLEGA